MYRVTNESLNIGDGIMSDIVCCTGYIIYTIFAQLSPMSSATSTKTEV